MFDEMSPLGQPPDRTAEFELRRHGTTRPSTPSTEVLDAAAASLRALLEAADSPVWHVTGPQNRARSTLFRLTANHAGTTTRAFYKTEYVATEGKEDGWVLTELTRRWRSMRVERTLMTELTQAVDGSPIKVERALDVRPELLTSVRLAVPGRPLGPTLWRALPGRRQRGLDLYELIGRASRIIETVGFGAGPALTPDACRELAAVDVSKSSPILTPGQIVRLREVIESLVERLDERTCSTWTHGDLSPSNVLVRGREIGLIDFSWAPHVAGRDVAQFIVRLHGEAHQNRRWTSEAAAALLRGYGVDLESPSWRLAYLQRLLRCVRKENPAIQAWGQARLATFLQGPSQTTPA